MPTTHPAWVWPGAVRTVGRAMPKSISLALPAVENAHRMRRTEPRTELFREAETRGIRQPFGLIEQVAKRHAAHVLHRNVGHAIDLAEVVGAQHVRVGDLARELDLALEPLQLGAVAPQLALEHLECHEIVQLAVARLVDDPHSARPENREDFETRAH